ncbi:MAG TPA: alpha-ketoglutarate-dependent dioxygenase AlkB [Myxococcaceae bacterium]|nr:alpha-ketoglutarate-dependent dioxygenase AlkB [Myxococcaceae bacterium]
MQPSLFDHAPLAFDRTFSRLERIQLDETAWIDVVPAWVSGSDALFQTLLDTLPWAQRTRFLYEQHRIEPRLTASWHAEHGRPLAPPILEEMRSALSERYGVEFDSAGFNLYRDGRDSVAWHRDKIPARIHQPIVALVSLGEPRRFLLRPRGGGTSRPFPLGHGDLLVTGGETQRTWEHAVLKVAHAGPRISIALRHGMDVRVYG